ncbi:MAG: J domain-containing protein [Chloroflexi bacterium]|nr:J domain-containing protein [Chloroflexota bacterium]
MTNQDSSPAKTSWHEQIEKIEALLATLRPRLIEAEAELAERLASINAFEFKLRSRIAKLTDKLDKLDAAIQELKRKMRWLGEGWQTDAENEAAAWAAGETASESGDYRYRDVAKEPRQALAKEEKASLKKLYRQLARRFHPDMAVDDADRAYRTQMMMAINAAYAAGDLEKLEQLLLEPDAPHTIVIQSETEQLTLLTRELTRVQNRLQELEDELARLDKHQSTEMMRRQARAAQVGRDWFAEVEAQLEEDIAQRQIEHDVLTIQLANVSSFDDTAVTNEDFPDIVLDATEDRIFEADISDEFDRFNGRRRSQDFFE